MVSACTALGKGEDTGQAANTGNSHWECASARGSSRRKQRLPRVQIAVLLLRNVKNKFQKVEDGVWTAAASPKRHNSPWNRGSLIPQSSQMKSEPEGELKDEPKEEMVMLERASATATGT